MVSFFPRTATQATNSTFWNVPGGIFSLPPFLSPEARHLLSRMLTVDSNKRIKLHEIRQLPWFQKDLPSYLFAPATSVAPSSEPIASDDNSRAALWSQEEEGKEGSLPNRRREWVAGLGVVDQEIVDDLCGKIGGLKSDDVWSSLQTGKDKELRIAYQLCRDNKRMVEGCTLLILFLSSLALTDYTSFSNSSL